MKKLFLLLAFLGVVSFGCTTQANAGVHVGIGIGVPGYYGGYYGPGPGYYYNPYYGYGPYYGAYYPGYYGYYGYYGHGYYGHRYYGTVTARSLPLKAVETKKPGEVVTGFSRGEGGWLEREAAPIVQLRLLGFTAPLFARLLVIATGAGLA